MSNEVALRGVLESVAGTTPVDSTNWFPIPYSGAESLNAQADHVQSNQIVGGAVNRVTPDMVKIGETVNGSIPFELQAGDFDVFLEAVMMDEWAIGGVTGVADQLGIGKNLRTYTLEKEFIDYTKFISFVRMALSTLNMNFQARQIVTGSFGFMGVQGAVAATSLVGAGSVSAVTSNPVINAASQLSAIEIDAAAIGATTVVRSIQLSLNNNLRPIDGIGRAITAEHRYGDAAVSAQVNFFVNGEAIDLYTASLANTVKELSWTVSDGTKSYTFHLPVSRVVSPAPNSQGRNADDNFTLTFHAVQDSFTITRVT